MANKVYEIIAAYRQATLHILTVAFNPEHQNPTTSFNLAFIVFTNQENKCFYPLEHCVRYKLRL